MNSTDVDVVSQFVLRARRVAAHSLAQNTDSLRELAGFKITGQVKNDGSFIGRRRLPDEEAFESLAARVRPFTLGSEPIYAKKVFDALWRLQKASPVEVEDTLIERLLRLEQRWLAIDLQGTKPLAFQAQIEPLDGSSRSSYITDIQLAASWMYADLVHSDAKGPKREGLRFPIKERYSAAVNVFSRVALLCLATHEVVMELHEAGVIGLDLLSLEADVVVGLDELVDEGVAYLGPVDSPLPDLDVNSTFPPAGWQQFTPTVLLRMDPRNQVEVELTGINGQAQTSYAAAVSKLWAQGDELHWVVLIGEAVVAEFMILLGSEKVEEIRLVSWEGAATTNLQKLAEAKLQRDVSEAHQVTFFVAKEPFFTFEIPRMGPKQAASVDVSIDTLSDLTAIEAITGHALAPLSGSYTLTERVRLRQARLLLEGKVVPLDTGPIELTAAPGVIPGVIMGGERTFAIGNDTSVTMPRVAIRHPLMQPSKVTKAVNNNSPVDRITMEVPVREPFLAWVRELVSVHDDNDLRTPETLGLSHVDERNLFGGWDGTLSLA